MKKPPAYLGCPSASRSVYSVLRIAVYLLGALIAADAADPDASVLPDFDARRRIREVDP